jgi:hypothetical protein
LFTGVFVRDPYDLFLLPLPEADEGVGGDRTGEDVKAGRGGMRTETSAWGISVAETTSDNTEADVNMSAETLMTDAAASPEVWIVRGKFILGCAIFVKFEMMY